MTATAGWVDALRAREPDFRRAPSAHNTQPWTLSYGTDDVRIGVDPARSLPVSDPTGRDLALGLGAFVESCLIAAADAALPVRAVVGPAGLVAPGRDVPAVRLEPAPVVYPTPFTVPDLQARRVARGRYAPGALPAAVLAELGPGVAAVPARALVGDLAAADRWMFATPAVARELEEWLRLHPRHPRYRIDGLTDRAMALSRFEARALDVALTGLRTVPVLRRGLPALLAAAGRGLLRGDGTVLVLTALSEEEGVAGRVAAGRRLLRTWLTLARHGLAVHPVSQLLDCPTTAARLRARLREAGPAAEDTGAEDTGAETTGAETTPAETTPAETTPAEPLAVFRVGTPLAEPVRSARLPAGA